MLEIDDEIRRANILARLGGIEETITLKIGDEVVQAVAEEDVDRTTADGKTSSIHFLALPHERRAIGRLHIRRHTSSHRD